MKYKLYKPSKFNLSIDISEEELLLFNTFSTSLIKLKKEVYSQLLVLLEGDNLLVNKGITEKFIDLGFLVKHDFDEVEFIKIKNRQWRHNPISYSIAIVPNIDCNFNCKYCFEEISPKYMSESTIVNIETYVKNRIKKKLINYLGVSWYGGEPLLSKKIIERLSSTFSEVEKYHSTIFTNGYAFDDHFIKNLDKYGVDLVHITLDGPSEIHNKYRYLKNGSGTYEKIKENIKKIVDQHGKNVYLNIRMNLDSENKLYCQDLIEEFKEISQNNISFIIARIIKTTSGNGQNFCTGLEDDYFDEIRNFGRKILVKNGFKKPFDFLPKNLKCCHCYVGLDNGFTINYDGSIYKCFGDVNPPQNKIGQLLSTGEVEFINDQYFKWFGYDFYDNYECRDCVLLPICMGDCAHRRLGLTPNSNSECDHLKVLQRTKKTIIESYNLKYEL